MLAAADLERAGRPHVPPQEMLAECWSAWTRSEWLYGARDAWDLIADGGPGAVGLAVEWWTERHGDARPILSPAARREAARLRRAGGAP